MKHHPRYFILLDDHGPVQLLIVSDSQLDAMAKFEVLGIPTYINSIGSRVWPNPDKEYDIFKLAYCGTVGVNR